MTIITRDFTFEEVVKALPLVPPDQLKRKWLSWQKKLRAQDRALAEMARLDFTNPPPNVWPNEEG